MYIVLGCKISYIGVGNFDHIAQPYLQAGRPFERCSSFTQTLILLRSCVGLQPHGQRKWQLYLFFLFFFIHLFTWSEELKTIWVAPLLMRWFIFRLEVKVSQCHGCQLWPLTITPTLNDSPFRPGCNPCVCARLYMLCCDPLFCELVLLWGRRGVTFQLVDCDSKHQQLRNLNFSSSGPSTVEVLSTIFHDEKLQIPIFFFLIQFSFLYFLTGIKVWIHWIQTFSLFIAKWIWKLLLSVPCFF